ncbi:MAG: hypothetical protein HY719_09245 [Planctomycetes bacterium]|nr:hypothetical protein [Planctomycetota bacterium]
MLFVVRAGSAHAVQLRSESACCTASRPITLPPSSQNTSSIIMAHAVRSSAVRRSRADALTGALQAGSPAVGENASRARIVVGGQTTDQRLQVFDHVEVHRCPLGTDFA